jgi:hypothetical protein
MKKLRVLLAVVTALATIACTEGNRPGARERRPGEDGRREVLAGSPKKCSRAPIPRRRKDVRAVAFARGNGPVYVGLGSPDVIRYTEDTRKHEGWHYYKTLWAIAPEYRGDVTITGQQINGSTELRFNAGSGFPGEKRTELHFSALSGSEWRYGPSDTLIRAEGCYALRIEGEDVIDWVTFIARA